MLRRASNPTLAELFPLKCRALVYKMHGDPLAVLRVEEVSVIDSPRLEADPSKLVQVRFLASPVNPSDFNQIQGTYPLRPELPAIGGNEGVAQIESIGTLAHGFSVGDWVLPVAPGNFNCWRERLATRADNLIKIPNDIPIEAAATMLVNPPTAYRMLEDFVNLQEGDVIIQNGANSAVGRAVIQIAKIRGLVTINVVRDRPDFQALELELKTLGATTVVKADRLVLPETKTYLDENFGIPKLALNCVGGDSATDLAKSLSKGGTLVTYGGMSKKPVTIPTSLLIFKQLRVYGYWNSAWYLKQQQLHTSGDLSMTKQRERMMSDLVKWYREGKLAIPPTIKHSLDDWKNGIIAAQQPYLTHKHIFTFE